MELGSVKVVGKILLVHRTGALSAIDISRFSHELALGIDIELPLSGIVHAITSVPLNALPTRPTPSLAGQPKESVINMTNG
tara:strand:- start:1686 stop:1928 length:243 start_codon:yes stop_codon:yes gene_type:complete